MPVGVPRHRLTNVDRDGELADCSRCGEGIAIRIKDNKARCRVSIREAPSYQNRKQPGHKLRKNDAHALRRSYTCYICGETEFKDLFVDHCHTTGRVRGILCRKHNSALGVFEDNIAYLEKAIEYLKNPPLYED